jgi:Zn-dependent membrane protease YugP
MLFHICITIAVLLMITGFLFCAGPLLILGAVGGLVVMIVDISTLPIGLGKPQKK